MFLDFYRLESSQTGFCCSIYKHKHSPFHMKTGDKKYGLKKKKKMC